MTDEVFAHRVSLVVRWSLAALFAYLAYQYQEARILYLFSAALFVTGFLKPKRCTDTGCAPEPQKQNGKGIIHFEELK